MFELFETQSDTRFTWGDIGNVADGRQNLGEDMPVVVYRLFQFTIKDELTKRFGAEEAIDIFRKAGALAGREFATHMLDLNQSMDDFISQLQKVLAQTKMGILRVEQFNPETGEATLTVGEDLDCSGLPITGDAVCNYDEGFLAGILQTYTKQKYIVTEIDCWATGSRVCRFLAEVSSET